MHYHARFLALVGEIEETFPVTRWKVGDVDVWPLARSTLYANVCRQSVGMGEPSDANPRSPYLRRLQRAAALAATPLINLWRGRSDLSHIVVLPRPACTLFFGDERGLDKVEGAWRDRYYDPLISHLSAGGGSTLVMQRGDLRRLPLAYQTFPANTIINWGQLLAAGLRKSARLAHAFPRHEEVLECLRRHGVFTQGLNVTTLRDRAVRVSATAYGFEVFLQRVRPSLCFLVGYFAGMGHALVLACRRRGVLSVELQRGGLGPHHEEYHFSSFPDDGYSLVPAVFWCWTEEDAITFEGWTKGLPLPWHGAIYGGHPQFSPWFDDDDPQTQAHDIRIGGIRAQSAAKIEILVALQNLDRRVWDALAALIERSPPYWRWWLRRHPRDLSDSAVARLTSIRGSNVIVDEASSLPLPALLRHMDVLLSLSSGAAVEASLFGLRSIFLSPTAREMFPHLFASGKAEVIDDMALLEERLRNMRPATRTPASYPKLPDVLSRLQQTAAEYAALCAEHPLKRMPTASEELDR